MHAEVPLFGSIPSQIFLGASFWLAFVIFSFSMSLLPVIWPFVFIPNITYIQAFRKKFYRSGVGRVDVWILDRLVVSATIIFFYFIIFILAFELLAEL